MSDNVCENPFCTRRIRPGAIPFLFPAGQDAETLVERLRQNGWRGEVVGAHGSGKSALLATLIPAIEREERHVALVELHDGQRRLPTDFDRDCRLRTSMVLIVDGYEQLSRWRRWLLGRLCRRRGWGLLVTAHASVGLPPLYKTVATPELAKRIVSQLLAGQAAPLGATELTECLARRGGDLRETLFHLYDLFEENRRVQEEAGNRVVGRDAKE
jgi:hypothetical protein